MAKASKRPAKFGNSAIRASRRFTTSSAFETQPRPCRQTQSRGDLRIRTGDPRHGRERRGDRAVEGRPFVRLAIPAHRVTLQALGFMPYAAARRRLSASAIGTLPVSQSRISPVVGDCVVEPVGLEPTTKVLWNMVGVRPTPWSDTHPDTGSFAVLRDYPGVLRRAVHVGPTGPFLKAGFLEIPLLWKSPSIADFLSASTGVRRGGLVGHAHIP
jgi:hypothetical protein